MNYEESRAYIKNAQGGQWIFGLDNMRELMKRLGNPQDELQFVHVGGTNGKGSVIAYLYSVLSRAGYRVGRYISPTLYTYRERMEVLGKRISKEKFAGYVTETARVIDGMIRDGLPQPTPFEIETAIAFLFFRDEHCDLVLLEVGLGGEEDATNIIHNTKLAVLASISMDHMSILGNTLGEIAEKKSGIIKKGCHVVTEKQAPEAMEMIIRKCEETGVPYTVSDGGKTEALEESCHGQTFRYKGEVYRLSLVGVCQEQNAALALDALEILSENGYPTTISQRKEGLAHTAWNGRFTLIHEKPAFIVDGAHNPGAADMLVDSINHYFKGKRLIYIMGMFSDKDYISVIKKTVPYASKVLTIQTPDNPRALPAEELAAAVREFHGDVQAMDSIEAAVKEAFSLAGEDDVILSFGSLSFIGEITELVEAEGTEVMVDLQECRKEIDKIDSEIIRLFEQRMKVCEDVAKYKIGTGKKVLDPERERSKIETIQKMAHGEFNKLGAQELFQQIMAISRKRQYQLLTEHGVEEEKTLEMVEELPLKDISVVFQGVEGAYSYAAMREYFEDDIKSYHVKTWRDAMEEVSAGRADYAVLPIENSTAGIVADIYDLLTEYHLNIVGEQIIRVEHVLLGLPGASVKNISRVYSHPQGLAQCSKYLEEHPQWKKTAVENTAGAAKKVQEEKDVTQAAIASRQAGEVFGLDVLAENICHNDRNATRFIIVSKKSIYVKNAQKISICFELPHESGSLYNMLSHIIYNGLNMSKIESRPIPGKTWEYRFFVDFDGNLKDSAVKNALRGIEAEANRMRVLGNY